MRGVMPRHAQYWFGLAVLAGAVGVGSALQLSHHSDGTRPQSRNGRVQVFGRGELTFDERIAVELDYVENASLARDLEIMIHTLPAVLRGTGAY